MRRTFQIVALLCLLAAPGVPARAQTDEVPPPAPAYQPLSYDQLDQLLGPIALYPDPLIAEILPASTFPTQIVMADRYLSSGGDPNQADQQPWDPSVQALAHYPTLLQWMDQNLDWTTALGQAFMNQQQDVMDSIQRLRQSAYNLGNLQSTPQQQVIDDGGYIEILPVEEDQIYVPIYQPDEVYDQSGFPCTFGIGFPVGVWLGCDFDWQRHRMIVWNHDHPRPPNWWHQRPDQRDAVLASHSAVWRPSQHSSGVIAIRGDRGWGTPQNQPMVTTIGQSRTPMPAARPEAPIVSGGAASRFEAPANRSSVPVARSAPPTVEHFSSRGNSPSSGAFIGIQSAQETRSYSERGEQSTASFSRSEPASRPAPSSNSGGGSGHSGGGGGGGGGGHSGGGGGGGSPRR